MKVINSSKLVDLLNNGLDGEVMISGEVNAYREGNNSSSALFRGRGKFTLSRDEDGTHELRSLKEGEDYSFYFKRSDKLVRLIDKVIIPIDLAEFANVIIEPKQIKY